jgi:hypothetical protein
VKIHMRARILRRMATLAIAAATLHGVAAAQVLPDAVTFRQGWNSHSPASWHFQQFLDFSSTTVEPNHLAYHFWTNPDNGATVRFMDLQHRANADSGGKCWEYNFTTWQGERPDFAVYVNIGSTTAATWVLLADNGSPDDALPGTWRLWAHPGGVTRNWGALFRISAHDENHNEGVAILRVRHINEFSQSACESFNTVVRVTNNTRRIIRRDF